MNELGNTPTDKNYKPSGISRAEEAARKKYPIYLAKAVMSNGSIIEFDAGETTRNVFKLGYEQAEKDIYKEMKDRMEEIKDKQARASLEDLDYHLKIDPALGFDEGSVVVYHGKELINVLTIQDIELLHTFLYAVKNNKHGAFTFTRLTDEQYAEVLKRFKEAKK